MATRKTNNGGNKKSTGTRKSTTTKRKTSTSGRKTSTGRASTTSPTIIRAPREGDSTAYRIFYIVITVAIVVGVFAWQNGYLDRFLMGTPLEQYAVGTGSGTTGGSGNGQVIATEGAIDPNTLDTTWSEDRAPDYFEILDPNDAHLDFTVEKGEFVYGGWDELGRTLRVYGCPTHETWESSAGWRAPMPASADSISGWGNNKEVTLYNSDGTTTKSWFYNRSHLCGDSLGASTDKYNLITATRQQNAPQGMRHTETLAEDYLKNHKDGYVYYSATPIYQGDELLARAVYVQIQSDDKSINEAVLVFNAAKGYSINYTDGTFEFTGV